MLTQRDWQRTAVARQEYKQLRLVHMLARKRQRNGQRWPLRIAPPRLRGRALGDP